ncbi:uncharacterized protein LOC142225942 isoform X1 [Haematobia irritans]|uniref:uncharacterized protein LOC142225942 isoform X1 n=2 Tax=Haematobia irritans TaxID=7368 RepID=UPI003F504CBB
MLTVLLTVNEVRKSLFKIQRCGTGKKLNHDSKNRNLKAIRSATESANLLDSQLPDYSNFIIMSASPTPPLKSENIDGGLNNSTVIISFKPGDKQCCQEISNRNVRVIANPGKHDHGSSKVKLKNIVDYKWEVKNYPGHLIAVHIDEKHIAYVINALYFQVPCKIVKYPCYIPSESNRNDASDM